MEQNTKGDKKQVGEGACMHNESVVGRWVSIANRGVLGGQRAPGRDSRRRRRSLGAPRDVGG